MTQKISTNRNWLLIAFYALGNHTLSLVFILLIYALLSFVPQINDLIAVIPQLDDHWLLISVLFSTLVVFAFLITYVYNFFEPPEDSRPEDYKPSLLRIPKDAKEQAIKKDRSTPFEEDQEQFIQRILPKLLGTLLLLIVAFAVNNTYEIIFEDRIFLLGNWGLLVVLGLFALFLNKKITGWFMKLLKKMPGSKYYAVGVASGALFLIIWLGLDNSGGDKADVKNLFLSLIALSVFFLVVSSSYNKWVLWFKNTIGGYAVLFATSLSLLLYIVLFFSPGSLHILTPLPILMICLLGIFFLANLIKLAGYYIRFKPLLGVLTLVAAFISIVTANLATMDHYAVSAVEIDPKVHGITNRLSLESYVREWISDRRKDILQQEEGTKFPIVMVSSEGGGSRAALWSLLVQGYLYEQNPNFFKKHLFSISGASGGGVGNNMFYAQAWQLEEGKSEARFKYASPREDLNYRASNVFHNDFLSTSVASIMGRDLFKNITTVGWHQDRGKLLEQEWEEAFAQHYEYPEEDNPLSKPYLDLLPDTLSRYIKPLLITSTTHLQSGQRTVISPVDLSEDVHNLNVFLDLLGCYPDEKTMIKRSTAMSLNARFPFLSPVGRVEGLGQFGDAGYYNNIGGAVTWRLQHALEQELAKDTALTDKYQIKHLLITNYETPWCENGVNMRSQLLAPALMIWNATFAHPTEMERTFAPMLNVQSRRTAISPDQEFLEDKKQDEPKKIVPVIPLGRYLSKTAVRSLEERLKVVAGELDAFLPLENQ